VIAGPGDEIAAPEGRGRDEIRASDADREQVIGTLKAAFVQGMLAKDEFDQRLGRAFAARTHAELAALTADFPVNLVAAPPPEPVRAEAEAEAEAEGAGAAPPAAMGRPHTSHQSPAVDWCPSGHVQVVVIASRGWSWSTRCRGPSRPAWPHPA
jgi:hypothetical protein